MLVGLVRLTNASAFDDLVVRFNNDSAANYGSQYVRGNQATASAAEVVTSASPTIARLPAASATANFAGVFELLIPNYAGTTFSKQAVCKTFGASALTTGVMIAETTGVAWSSTAAITRVDLFGATTANAKAGSRVTLYGIS